MRGQLRPPPPLSAKLRGRFSIRKRYFIASGLDFPNILQTFVCDVTDDDGAQVKGKIIDILFLPALPGKAALSN